ncbi:hypothetical protein [uncultured Hyphomicrobium sp.]|uniref:hypothetical protein n=1 Tax=uncultured Hyphomicrobium sp. TaxID=194373 RepID=UPI0025E300A1|nr:hypothetical protein [uncultured Hyphomicrobium sp.]
MTADLSALIARLEAAEVGSHELDKAVSVACGSTIQVWAETASDGTFLGSVRPVTTSLDAALALVERVLPGWSWEIYTAYQIKGLMKYGCNLDEQDTAYAFTPALALCLAVLKARQSD